MSENTSHVFAGTSLAIVVPPGRERTTLNWTGLDVDDSAVYASTKFVNDLEGTLEWDSQRDGTDKIFWGIDLELNGELNWTLNTVSTARDQERPCEIISFSVLQIRSDGTISEVQRTCNGSSDGSLKLKFRSQVLVLLHIKSIDTARSKLRVSWTHHDDPPEKNVDGIAAGTIVGAFVIPLSSAHTKVEPKNAQRLPTVATRPVYVAVHLSKGLFFWSTPGEIIVRANLDGSSAIVLLETVVRGLTVDEHEDRLYWGSYDGIGSCDLNGQDIRELPNIAVNIRGVAIDNDKVYYGAWDTDAVHVTSKLGTNSVIVAQLTTNVLHMTFFGSRVPNKPSNPYAKAKCAHLCILVTRWTYRCTCPDDQVLNADGKTCNI